MEYVALFQLNMVIFFVVIWKHVWRIIVYKVKENQRWNKRKKIIENGIVQKKEENEKIVIKKENTTNPNVK